MKCFWHLLRGFERSGRFRPNERYLFKVSLFTNLKNMIGVERKLENAAIHLTSGVFFDSPEWRFNPIMGNRRLYRSQNPTGKSVTFVWHARFDWSNMLQFSTRRDYTPVWADCCPVHKMHFPLLTFHCLLKINADLDHHLQSVGVLQTVLPW